MPLYELLCIAAHNPNSPVSRDTRTARRARAVSYRARLTNRPPSLIYARPDQPPSTHRRCRPADSHVRRSGARLAKSGDRLDAAHADAEASAVLLPGRVSSRVTQSSWCRASSPGWCRNSSPGGRMDRADGRRMQSFPDDVRYLADRA